MPYSANQHSDSSQTDESSQSPADSLTGFTVKIEGFEGPMDLLLSLIEKRKLPISEVSLSAVTESFIEHVNEHAEFPVRQTANFVLVASTLLLIKSKALLPMLDVSPEEEGSIEDLEKRLKLYKRFKDLAKGIADRFGVAVMYRRERSLEPVVVFAPDPAITIPLLHTRVRELIANLPSEKVEERDEAVVTRVVSLEETIQKLAERVTASMRMSFREFSGATPGEKVDVIVTFLAMLELVKQGIISVRQEKRFDDIEMESGRVGVPRYS